VHHVRVGAGREARVGVAEVLGDLVQRAALVEQQRCAGVAQGEESSAPPPAAIGLLRTNRRSGGPLTVLAFRVCAARLPAGDELDARAGVDRLGVAAVRGVDRVDGAAGEIEGGEPTARGRPGGAVVGGAARDRVLAGAIG
jgi:hypothetical protein